jgi:hypothetical protein
MIFHNQKFKIYLQIKSIICKIIFFEMQKIYQKYEIHIGKFFFQLLRNKRNKIKTIFDKNYKILKFKNKKH